MASRIRAVLLDLDGVLYVEDEPVPARSRPSRNCGGGSSKLRFATNTTSRPRRRILERLEGLGFAVDASRARHPRRARGPGLPATAGSGASRS